MGTRGPHGLESSRGARARRAAPLGLGAAWLALAGLFAAGCGCEPQFIVSPAGGYVPETLSECGCLPPEPAGQLIALMTPTGTFTPRSEVIVSLGGSVIQTGNVGPAGALAMRVAQPSSPGPDLAGATIDVAVDDARSASWYRPRLVRAGADHDRIHTRSNSQWH